MVHLTQIIYLDSKRSEKYISFTIIMCVFNFVPVSTISDKTSARVFIIKGDFWL